MRKIIPVGERLAARTQKMESGCMEWRGTTNNKGYGMIYCGTGKPELVHRVAWELAKEKIPFGGQVLHRCDNPLCVNPEHLFLGTVKSNVLDMRIKWRTKSKLTKAQVEEIRVAPGKYRDIANRYGLASHKSVYNIKRGLSFQKDVVG